MNYGVEQFSEFNQEMIQVWKQSPFMRAEGIEVFENLELNGRGLEGKYRHLRDNIMSLSKIAEEYPNTAKALTVATLGSSGVAKGSTQMGLRRLLIQDMYLQDWLKKKNLQLEILPVLFALYAPVAQLQETHEISPDLAVPPHLKHGEFTPEEYSKISRLAWMDINHYLNYAKTRSDLLTVFLVEAPGMTAYPTEAYTDAKPLSPPVEVEGTDRGSTIIYNLACDPRTRFNTYIVTIERQAEVRERLKKFRGGLDVTQEGWNRLLLEDISCVITNQSGEEKNIAYLDDGTQKALISFLEKAMASNKAIARSDREITGLLNGFYDQGLITSPIEKAYFNFISKRLNFPPKNFWILYNKYLPSIKTFDFSYLFDSLAVRLHPQIVKNVGPILLS